MKTSCPYCATQLEKAVGFCTSCGQAIGKDVLLGGAQIKERFQIVKALKASELGNVYKALDLHLGGVNCLIREMLSDHIDLKERNESIECFRKETYIQSGLRHQGLPSIKDYFEHIGKQYVIMDYFEGESLIDILKDHIRRKGCPLPQEKVINWAVEICNILEFLHTQPVPYIFREIKPSNVMLEKNSEKIILFNMESDFRQYIKGERLTSETPGYTPKEQFDGNPEPRSDLYALGKTMSHLLTGVEPNPFTRIRISKYCTNLTEGLERLIEIAIDEDPARRFPNAKKMREALELITVKDSTNQTFDDAGQYTEKALQYLKNHQIDEAIMECNKAIMLNPSHMDAYLYLGHAYLKECRAETALTQYKKAEKLDPLNTRIHCNMALAYCQMGNIPDAIRENEKAIEIDANNIFAINNLGSIYRDMGKIKEAIDYYQRALSIDQGYAAAHYNLGLTYYEMGNYTDSANESEMAIEHDPGNVHARINLGLAYYHLGETELFIKQNKEVLTYDPNNARAHNNLGVAYYAGGDYENAVASFKKALFNDKNMEAALQNLKSIEEELKTKEK